MQPQGPAGSPSRSAVGAAAGRQEGSFEAVGAARPGSSLRPAAGTGKGAPRPGARAAPHLGVRGFGGWVELWPAGLYNFS
jgi:hypothetical protein